MTKNVIVGLVVVGVVAVGGVAYVAMSGSKSNDTKSNQSSIETTANNSNPEAVQKKSSIQELISQNKDRECTYGYNKDNVQMTGTAFFAGDKRTRMNYTTTQAGKTTSASMIVTKDTQIFWDNGSKQGFRFKTSSETTTPSAQTQQQAVDTKQEMNFDCKSWNVNESYFTPPGDVTIRDFSSLTMPTQ